ncbi:hypothetical protein QYF36_013275 [Acer negundo]|nr:hypothetical protein QYF36_013275 [Acer negundo]
MMRLRPRKQKVIQRRCQPPLDDAAVESGVVESNSFDGRRIVVPYNMVGSNYTFVVAWALTNIASRTSKHTRAVVDTNDANAVPTFVNILRSSLHSDDLKEQAIWALGNVAGDSTEYRDTILQLEAMNPLITLVWKFCVEFWVNSSKLRTAVRTLSNLCCGKAPPPFEKVVGREDYEKICKRVII